MISSEQHLALAAILFAGAAFGFWGERQPWGRSLSGAMLAILFGALLSNLGAIPTSAPVYSVVSGILVPAAIPLLLLHADLRRIVAETGWMLAAFALGTLGTVLGVVAGLWLVDLGTDQAVLSGIFAATYIGGSMNFVAVAQALGFDQSSTMAGAVAADNVVSALYLLVLVMLPRLAWLVSRWPAPRGKRIVRESVQDHAESLPGPLQCCLALAVTFAVCAVGNGLAEILGTPRYGVLYITALALVVANLWPDLTQRLKGHFELGTVFMYLFFVTIGAAADLAELAGSALVLLWFAAVIVTVHGLVIVIGGRLLRIDLAEIVIASNACVLGPATAAGAAAGQGWRALVTPGILCGVLGYAAANFIGVGLAEWLAGG